MTETLEFAPQEPREYLSILLYGPSGIGKSTGAASAPGPIIYVNADGPGALRFPRRHHQGKDILELALRQGHARAVFEQLYIELRDGTHSDVSTIALDSLGRIYDLVLDEIANGGKPSLPNRGDANTFIERYVLALLELPFHLVLVAHDNPVVVTGKEEDGTAEVELFPHTGTGNPGLAKKLMRPLDVVAYCGRTVEEADDGEQREVHMAQTFHAGGRHAKDRTDVVGRFAELDLSDWIARVKEAYAPAKTTTGKTNPKEQTA